MPTHEKEETMGLSPARTPWRPSGEARLAAVLVVAMFAGAGTACGGAGEAPPEGAPERAPEPPTVRAEPGRPFDLPYGSTAAVAGGALTIGFRRLAEESRCPAGVQCPAAGNAAAELAVETSDGAAATLILNTARRPGEAPAHGWGIRLEGLAPEPEAGAPVDTAAYVATLVVERAE